MLLLILLLSCIPRHAPRKLVGRLASERGKSTGSISPYCAIFNERHFRWKQDSLNKTTISDAFVKGAGWQVNILGRWRSASHDVDHES